MKNADEPVKMGAALGIQNQKEHNRQTSQLLHISMLQLMGGRTWTPYKKGQATGNMSKMGLHEPKTCLCKSRF